MASYSLREGSTRALRKVPEITAIFWILKLLTTAMGEATSDYLVYTINQYLAVFVAGVILLIVLIIQLKKKHYEAWAYWLCVSMVAVFGTMAADGLHIRLHVPYIDSTIFFAVILTIVFITWRISEKTLSIHSIYTLRREVFYWATVMATFALGTAAGDLTATTAKLGYLTSGLMFIGVILIPLILYYIFHLSEVFCFWFAYVLTRPLGASFADWTAKPKGVGGLALGDGHVAIVLSLLIVILVTYLAITKADTKS